MLFMSYHNAICCLSPLCSLVSIHPVACYDTCKNTSLIQSALVVATNLHDVTVGMSASILSPRSMYTSMFMAQKSRSSRPGVNQADAMLSFCFCAVSVFLLLPANNELGSLNVLTSESCPWTRQVMLDGHNSCRRHCTTDHSSTTS